MREGWRDRPDLSRLRPGSRHYDQIIELHRRAVAAGLPTYRDPATGFIVMTATQLAARGYCCCSGCRHCPWAGAEADADA